MGARGGGGGTERPFICRRHSRGTSEKSRGDLQLTFSLWGINFCKTLHFFARSMITKWPLLVGKLLPPGVDKTKYASRFAAPTSRKKDMGSGYWMAVHVDEMKNTAIKMENEMFFLKPSTTRRT